MKLLDEDKYKILLIGDGELKNDILTQINELNLKEKFIFLENVNNVNEYMQAMDIFLLPSLFEGLPLVGIEAQMAGLPCIFSKNIDKTVKIIPSTIFRDLDYELWKNEIMNSK